MVILIVYLELEGIFWIKAGNGAQAKRVYRCYFPRLERGEFSSVLLSWVLAQKLTGPHR